MKFRSSGRVVRYLEHDLKIWILHFHSYVRPTPFLVLLWPSIMPLGPCAIPGNRPLLGISRGRNGLLSGLVFLRRIVLLP